MANKFDTETRQKLAKAVAAGMYALDNVSRGLGIEIVEARPHCTRMRMTVRGDMLNAHAICHGGVIFTLRIRRSPISLLTKSGFTGSGA